MDNENNNELKRIMKKMLNSLLNYEDSLTIWCSFTRVFKWKVHSNLFFICFIQIQQLIFVIKTNNDNRNTITSMKKSTITSNKTQSEVCVSLEIFFRISMWDKVLWMDLNDCLQDIKTQFWNKQCWARFDDQDEVRR